jgi:hypothetical protein
MNKRKKQWKESEMTLVLSVHYRTAARLVKHLTILRRNFINKESSTTNCDILKY